MQQLKRKRWICREREFLFGSPLVMAIVNVTPDSFYAGSRVPRTEDAIARGVDFFRRGAQILDVGGESTRPGAEPVPIEEEIRRVVPVIQGLRKACPEALISVDTRRTAVALAALEAGAHVLNDVAGCDPDAGMWELVASSGAGYILMHARGNPKTMDSLTDYDDVTASVRETLLTCAEKLVALGARPEQIMLDPGLGFAKTHRDSLQLLADTALFAALPYPYLVAASRKRFLSEITDTLEAAERGPASVGAALWAIAQGANAVRVHDVAATLDALRVFLAAEQTMKVNVPGQEAQHV